MKRLSILPVITQLVNRFALLPSASLTCAPVPPGIPTNHAAAKSLQSCLTLGDPIDGSPPGSPVPGILQARTLEWVAVSFSEPCYSPPSLWLGCHQGIDMFYRTPQDYTPLTDHQSGGPGLPLQRTENVREQFRLLSLRKCSLPPPHLLTDGDNLSQKWHPDLG